MSDDLVLLSIEGGVARLVLNRPDKVNSFTVAAHAALSDALDRIEQDSSCRCLVLSGAGKGFCAGQDLNERIRPAGAPPPDLGASLDRLYNPLIRRLKLFPFPVIASVHGVAAGAGASLTLAADIVLATRSAKFAFGFARLGLVPDGGGSWILPRLVGQARAAGLALLGETLTGDQAAAWGLIWKSVEDDKLGEETDAIVRQLLSYPPIGLAAIKYALQVSSSNTLDAQLDYERDAQREMGLTRDYQEGVTAFLEKRPAKFEGR
jgi:2-(1,2-epoxy-1,2-dihydrophenyl)acetyl-CoA isomerase